MDRTSLRMGAGGIEPLAQPPHLSLMSNGVTVRREEQLPKRKAPWNSRPRGPIYEKYVDLLIPLRTFVGVIIQTCQSAKLYFCVYHSSNTIGKVSNEVKRNVSENCITWLPISTPLTRRDLPPDFRASYIHPGNKAF